MSARTRFPARLPDLLADDRTLLARFADRQDETAFAALVRRHGGMVLGVCRRAVRDHQLAEDAVQAVFLVLARNPTAATRATSVAGWLFGVARRVGLAARRHRDRHRRHEQQAAGPRLPPPDPDWDDLLRVLDEELAALPDVYRSPLLACFLQERTQDEAARELGWSLSTLRRRLDRGKELLRARLTRRGATLSAGLFAGALAPATASATPRLIEDTLRLVGGETPGSPVVNALAAGGLGGSVGGKLAVVVGVLLLGGLAAGVGQPAALPPDPPDPLVVAVPPNPPLPKAAAPVVALAAPAPPREWVRVTGRVVFPDGRAIPARREIFKTDRFVKDVAHVFSNGRQFFDDLLVDPDTRGVKNAVVWLRPDDEDRYAPFPKEKLRPGDMTPKEYVIDTGCCQFSPRVIAAKAGDVLRFVNPARVAHTVDYTPAGGWVGAPRAFSVLLPSGGRYVDEKPLPAHSGVDCFHCNIHPWMKGYVWAFDHPYSAVTTADGSFAIPVAPVGTWRLMVWHEKTGQTDLKGPRPGRKVVVKDGPNGADLGAIPLESDAWDERDKGE
ncbi:MAG: sigE 52 [Gemmataceae bacterium]|nr:sigE 52 [Gemmataceae bacterium]